MSRPVLCALLAALALPGAAHAQWTAYAGAGPNLARTDVVGAVTVEYVGDEAAGCEARGVCDVAGRVTWSPDDDAEILWSSTKRGRVEASLVFDDARPRSQVYRGDEPACSDLGPSRGWYAFRGTSAAGVRVGLATTRPPMDVFATQCPAPLLSDIAEALPSRVVSVETLREGGGVIDLRADARFSGGGFSGFVRSSLALYPHASRTPPTDGATRVRLLQARYRLARVHGLVATSFTGDPQLCASGDACGATGTNRLTLAGQGGRVWLSAFGARRTPWRALARALGLRAGRRPKGVPGFGEAAWAGGGSMTTTLRRPDESFCSDTAPAGTQYLSLAVDGARLRATLYAPINTRCGALLRDEVVAEGSVPLTKLRHRTVVLRLDQGARPAAGAWSATTTAGVTVVLERTAVKRRRF